MGLTGLAEDHRFERKVECMTRVTERLFRDDSAKDECRLFHATLPGDTGEALCPAVNGKQDKSLPIQ